MKYSETIASRCRYGDIAQEIWGDADIIWEDSSDDWQGHATILAIMPDGRYSYYEWSYGSCSRCDEWEGSGKESPGIKEEMVSTAMWFNDIGSLFTWLNMLRETDREKYLAISGALSVTTIAKMRIKDV